MCSVQKDHRSNGGRQQKCWNVEVCYIIEDIKRMKPLSCWAAQMSLTDHHCVISYPSLHIFHIWMFSILSSILMLHLLYCCHCGFWSHLETHLIHKQTTNYDLLPQKSSVSSDTNSSNGIQTTAVSGRRSQLGRTESDSDPWCRYKNMEGETKPFTPSIVSE